MEPKQNQINPPVTLWLQWHGDGSPAEIGDVYEPEVTWAREKVFKRDVKYIRADHVKELLDVLHGLSLPTTRADYTLNQLDFIVCDIASRALKRFNESIKQ